MSRPARTVREVLVAARWILENVGWTKSAYAVDERGEILASRSSRPGVAYCVTGAINRVDVESFALLESAKKELSGGRSLIVFNDSPSTTLHMVLARFDEAIARAK